MEIYFWCNNGVGKKYKCVFLELNDRKILDDIIFIIFYVVYFYFFFNWYNRELNLFVFIVFYILEYKIINDIKILLWMK